MTKITLEEGLTPMPVDMQKHIVKASGNHTKDEVLLTADTILKVFIEYTQTRELPVEWREWLAEAVAQENS